MLEELGVPYNLHSISLSKNDQKEEWFLKINPNGRIPALGELVCIKLLTRSLMNHSESF